MFSFILFSLILLCDAVPAPDRVPLQSRASSPTVTLSSPAANIVGVGGGAVEKFLGIPFAQPPVGNLRLKPPQAITKPMGTVMAQKNGKTCPQLIVSNKPNSNPQIPSAAIGQLANSPLFQSIRNEGEDCLVMNVYRPAGTKANAGLPVLFWIFGGAFEIGSNSQYDGTTWVQSSIDLKQPILFVSVNYRVAGLGFLSGKEILADGSANIGLLDQRMGLKWVADNIAAFGGDPSKVTIWGESAGAISVFDQMILYNGNNVYKGKPLFRGAMMNSGSVVPADPVDGQKGQQVYDTVVKAAGCSTSANTLACLRTVPYQKYIDAMNSLPSFLSYSSVALSYLPRPDGKVLTDSPDKVGLAGKFAKVPIIIGDQEDEGTIFSIFQSNLSTKADVVDYLHTKFFLDADISVVNQLVNLYDPQSYGSPFRTPDFINNWYPQFKRLAGILGDLVFTITRRTTLNVFVTKSPNTPCWSYLSSYAHLAPILGTFHGSDIIQVFYGIPNDYASRSFRSYYISFVNSLTPNNSTDKTLTNWPQYSNGKMLLNMMPMSSAFIPDTFRNDVYNFILAQETKLHIKH